MAARRERENGRLIPAHAGKTSDRAVRALGVAAHPRSRGENAVGYVVKSYADGSSPLTRGKRRRGCPGHRDRRLIPAHAGKTVADRGPARRGQAHPRSRGENSHTCWQARPINGSSPLTRGKPLALIPGPHDSRLIPAHAGKTSCRRGLGRTRSAHPRSRGENRFRRSRASGPAGSSPLTRGKHVDRPNPPEIARLIPAHAGKTSRLGGASTQHKAHPRSRGENGSGGDGDGAECGSSPLTRGKRVCAATR